MREPVFTQITQIGIVVRDLDATIQQYVDEYGIGPCERHDELTPDNAKDLRVYGQPVALWRVAAATARVGQVMWELIAPLDDESIFARFLAEKGGGVQHIAVATPNFDEAVAAPAQRGHDLVLSGTFSGIRVAYLPTDRDLGVILEIFDGLPGAEPEPEATWSFQFRGRSIALPRSDPLVWRARPGDSMTQAKRPIIDESVTAYPRTLAGTNQGAEMGVGDRAVSPC